MVYGRYTELDNYSIHGVNLNQRSHPWGAHPVPFAINAARTWRGRGCDATPHGWWGSATRPPVWPARGKENCLPKMPFKKAGLANKYGGLTNKNGGLMKKNGAFTVKKYQKVPFLPAEIEVLSTNCQADIGKSNYIINIVI